MAFDLSGAGWRRLRAFAIAAGAALAMPACPPAGAAEPPAWPAGARCGAPVTITRALVAGIEAGEHVLGHAGGGGLPPFLAAGIPGYGSVLFVRTARGWRARLVEELGIFEAGFVAPGLGRMALFSILGSEGAGDHFTVVTGSGSLLKVQCATLAGPPQANPTDYLAIAELSIGRNGRGHLSGTAGEDGSQWYRARAAAWGRRWSEPVALPGKPRLAKGVFVRTTGKGLTRLVRDLKRAARKRRR